MKLRNFSDDEDSYNPYIKPKIKVRKMKEGKGPRIKTKKNKSGFED